jgi:hypothetical protein
MKKILSISFAFLILLSSMHITLATHYCGGERSASKVSFTGEFASCGMETDEDFLLPGIHIEKHCCDNHVSVFTVDHNYAPSSFELNAFAQILLQVYIVPASTNDLSLTAFNLLCTDIITPDNLLVNAVSLPKICVFRI